MSYMIGGFAVLLGLILAARWYAYADMKALKRGLAWAGGILLVALAIFFVVSGKFVWALMSLPALWPLIRMARQVQRQAKNFQRMASAAAGGPAGGGDGTTEAQTRYLDMTLDHETGAMAGRVTRGQFKGQFLDDMALPDIFALMAEAQSDPETPQILEAYLDRMRAGWHEQAEQYGFGAGERTDDAGGSRASSDGVMTPDEALAVLGLEAGATAAEIKAAHQRIITTIHPDKGGSDYLAAKVNAAKDVLLRG